MTDPRRPLPPLPTFRVDVPGDLPGQVLAVARRRRRRRTAALGGALMATVAALAVGTVVTSSTPGDTSRIVPAGPNGPAAPASPAPSRSPTPGPRAPTTASATTAPLPPATLGTALPLSPPSPPTSTQPPLQNSGGVPPAGSGQPTAAPGGPVVTVSPDQALTGGQGVRVTVAGFGPGEKVYLSQCATSRSATASVGCGQQLAAEPVIVTDATGAGVLAQPYRVTAQVGTTRCTTTCTLAATDSRRLAQQPLTFR